MTEFCEALAGELIAQSREHRGFFLLHLADGTALRARPAGLRYGKSPSACPRLLLRLPECRLRSIPVTYLEGFSPSPEGMLSSDFSPDAIRR